VASVGYSKRWRKAEVNLEGRGRYGQDSGKTAEWMIDLSQVFFNR
jgi:hypothetical protein